jgi:anti-sigma factor RsiW
MTCRELVELVTDYFEGALPADESARFEQHIDGCAWCARYVDQMRVTIAVVGRIDEQSISGEAKGALLHAFRDWNPERQDS